MAIQTDDTHSLLYPSQYLHVVFKCLTIVTQSIDCSMPTTCSERQAFIVQKLCDQKSDVLMLPLLCVGGLCASDVSVSVSDCVLDVPMHRQFVQNETSVLYVFLSICCEYGIHVPA